MAQTLLPVEDQLNDEDALSMDVPGLTQHMLHGPKKSQVGMDRNSGEDAVTLDNGSSFKSYRPPEQTDEAMKASGEHAVDLKERPATPKPLCVRGDALLQDINHHPTDHFVLSERTETAAELGDLNHDSVSTKKASHSELSAACNKEVLAECLSVGISQFEAVYPQPVETTANLQFSTVKVFDDVERDNHKADVADLGPQGVFRIDLLPVHGIQSGAAAARHDGSGTNEISGNSKNSYSEQAVPDVCEGDPGSSETAKLINAVDKSSSTTSLSASLGASTFGDCIKQEFRCVCNGATQTYHVSNVDESTQTVPVETRTGFPKVLALFLGICASLFYMLALYRTDLYESEFMDNLDFL
ncbi:uncharacterized protein LOC135401015 [Ornithodoros turicata]|uniref:uncharacterized protein LOC135401015 n=1 Tax=Ornithodoros turicata TaxID=34597 RepID=UPI0031393003